MATVRMGGRAHLHRLEAVLELVEVAQALLQDPIHLLCDEDMFGEVSGLVEFPDLQNLVRHARVHPQVAYGALGEGAVGSLREALFRVAPEPVLKNPLSQRQVEVEDNGPYILRGPDSGEAWRSGTAARGGAAKGASRIPSAPRHEDVSGTRA